MHLNHLIGLFLFCSFFSRTTHSFQASCKNESIPINVVVGSELDFHCESSQKFHSCVIERSSTEMKPTHCNFTFYSPVLVMPGRPRIKELQKVRWDCDLDFNPPYRIEILETKNEKNCHLKLSSVDLNGNAKHDINSLIVESYL